MSSTAKNDVTGDSIITKISSESYRNNFDAIFRKSKEVVLECNDQQLKDDYETKVQKVTD